ncbi:3-oxoacyl-[acyl-carrier-protein] synthase III C-terminal domain-containing protein [Streptomyces sp. NPDC002793]|uniref:3-oxoacyl-[acyl-carrier-protein] synthase III C-terminal domain-containing protein n=1 Tax=Streptomyces sp. NPDC002793 TaxID=3154432 RepID=UPI0033285C98
MTTLVEVSTHWPSQVPLASRQGALDLSDVELRRYHRAFGLSDICRDETRSETELLTSAVEKLSSLRGREDQVRYLIRARTQCAPAPYPDSALHEVRRDFGLNRASAFALTEHACASGLSAVDLAGMMLADDPDPDALALILVGEPARSPYAQILPGMGATGEGTAAVLVSHHGTRNRVLGFACRTLYTGDPSMVMSAGALDRFRSVYADAVVETIARAVADAGTDIGDIALLLPHNVNRIAWVRMADRIGLPLARIFLDNVPRTGHCFGADPFLNFETARALGRIQPGDRCLLVSVGLGATYAAMVVEH